MSHGYNLNHDTPEDIVYGKNHDDGAESLVNIQKYARGEWTVHAETHGSSSFEDLYIGAYSSKKEALKVARTWMKRNKRGINPPSNSNSSTNTSSEFASPSLDDVNDMLRW